MGLRVIVVDDERDRAGLVRATLEADGFTVVAVLGCRSGLPARIAGLTADVIIVEMDFPGHDTLEDLRKVGIERCLPVVMFAQDGKPETIKAAVDAGVSAYVVGGLQPDRVRSVIDVAIARFVQIQSLRGELDKVRATLAERKRIEKAKGILMKRRKVEEDEAYRLMRRMAMDQKQRLADVARKIIEAAELLG